MLPYNGEFSGNPICRTNFWECSVEYIDSSISGIGSIFMDLQNILLTLNTFVRKNKLLVQF